MIEGPIAALLRRRQEFRQAAFKFFLVAGDLGLYDQYKRGVNSKMWRFIDRYEVALLPAPDPRGDL